MVQVSVPMFYRVLGQPVWTPAYLAINEVQTAGSSGATDEFVEIYNPGTNAVDMSGWRLMYRSATGATETKLWSSNLVISAGGYLLVTGAAYSGSAPSDGGLSSGLAATGGAVGLRNPVNELVDSVGWGTATNVFVEGTAAPAPAAGKSLGRTPTGVDTNDNATDFRVSDTPSPRAAN